LRCSPERGAPIADPEDRQIIEQDLATLPP